MNVDDMTKKLVEAKYREIKQEAISQTSEMYTVAVLAVLRDKHGFGKKRLQKMTSDLESVFNSIAEGYVTKEELKEMILDETGVRI